MMKYLIKSVVLLSCLSFCYLSGETQVLAENANTAVKVELVKPILPGEYPDDIGNEHSRPKNVDSAVKSGAHLTVVNKVKKASVRAIWKSKFCKLLPKNGEKNNSWSIVGMGIMIFILLVILKKRKRKDS